MSDGCMEHARSLLPGSEGQRRGGPAGVYGWQTRRHTPHVVVAERDVLRPAPTVCS